MNYEFERMYKEVVAAQFEVLSEHFPGKRKGHHEKPSTARLRRDINHGPPEYKRGSLNT
jgi:hypothetical protein